MRNAIKLDTPEIIKVGSSKAKLLIPITDIKKIRFGDVLFIKTFHYYEEKMRTQYKFENNRSFAEYKDYVRVKVRDNQCFKLSSS